MIDDRHFEYGTLSEREVKQNRMRDKGYAYLKNLCGVDGAVCARHNVFGEILTFNYNTLDNTGKIITIKRTVQLEKEVFKDRRLLRNVKTDIFFDRTSNRFIYKG